MHGSRPKKIFRRSEIRRIIGNYVLECMHLLYVLEKQMREPGLNWEKKTKLSQEKSVPVLLELKLIDDSAIPTDNPKKHAAINLITWVITPPILCKALHKIGRKAFLFSDSHQISEMTAATYSFMAPSKKNGDEKQWQTDGFERIQSHKHKDLYLLLPNNWIKYRQRSWSGNHYAIEYNSNRLKNLYLFNISLV